MTNKAEKIVPYETDDSKGVQVEQMFDSIAGKYDLLNHTLSFGIDKIWRKKSVLSLKKYNPQTIIDIATGTGDLAITAYRLLQPFRILGTDISERMMEVGRRKVLEEGLQDYIAFERQDSMDLKIGDNSFDAAMVAFGVRNFENLEKGLHEILRVLKPAGRLMILEFSYPLHFPMKQAYWLYSKVAIPLVGRMISKDKVAYSYLPESIKAFPQRKEMTDMLLKCGFRNAQYRTFTFGICAMYLAEK